MGDISEALSHFIYLFFAIKYFHCRDIDMAAKLLSAAGRSALYKQQQRDWKKPLVEHVTMYKWMLGRYFQVYKKKMPQAENLTLFNCK